jgi:hypothetical protein
MARYAEQAASRLSAAEALAAEAAEIAAAAGNPGLMGTDTRGYDLLARSVDRAHEGPHVPRPFEIIICGTAWTTAGTR